MADDGVKISGLPEILTEPASGEMAAVVSSGVTYKRNIGTRLPSSTQKSALVGYGGTPSGTNPYATQAAVKPLSDLSRVFHIAGDGIPIFPDNVAGRTYWQDEWATTDSWAAWDTSCTLSVASGTLVLTGSGTRTYIACSKASINPLSKLHIVKCKNNDNVTQIGYFNGTTVTYQTPSRQGTVMWAAFYTSGTYTSQINIFFNFGRTTTTSDIVALDTIYIGSGLYDTPVYDKACCNRFTNNGVLPVLAPRGLGMVFNGAHYLEANNPVIGTTGTIAFKFRRNMLGTIQRIITNNLAGTSGYNGITAYFQTGNNIEFQLGGISALQTLSFGSFAETTNDHTAVIKFDGATVSYSIDGAGFVGTTQTVQVGQSVTNFIIGANPNKTVQFLGATLYDVRADDRLWTQADVTRYHNGDDPVDSQQKAVTNVPNAIKVCDSKGNIRQPGLPVYADNTAALAGGLVAGEPYRTSTGVLMVVY